MSDQAQKMGGDFLERAVSRARGEYAVLAPRLASLYEALDGPLVENGIVDQGIVDAATGADPNPLRSGDALFSATETGPQHAPDNPPRSRLNPGARPVARADDLSAPTPPKSLDVGADLWAKSTPQVQTYPELRLARGGDPRALAPDLAARAKSQQAVAPMYGVADFSQLEAALDHASPQVYVSHEDETTMGRVAMPTPRTSEKSAQLVAQPLRMQAIPEPFERAAAPAEPVIHVSIGRIEIRATQATNPPRAPRNAPKLMGLNEYLSKRGARE